MPGRSLYLIVVVVFTPTLGASIWGQNRAADKHRYPIAYARVNGITPPWTAETQQQQQKIAEKPKP